MDEDNKKDNDIKGIGDIIRRVVSVGAGANFMSEENIKNILGDLPIPKEILQGLVQNARTAKGDFTKSLREEFRKYLSKLDTEELIDYVLQNYEVNANLSFKKKSSKNNESTNEKTDKSKSE